MSYHSAIFLFVGNTQKSCSVVFTNERAAKNGVAEWFYRCTAVRPCTNTSYYVKYKKVAHSRGRGKASTWLDLELPVGAKCSWWRLDGYDTCSEGSGANAEEPTVGGMMELSLSNSDESSDESESG